MAANNGKCIEYTIKTENNLSTLRVHGWFVMRLCHAIYGSSGRQSGASPLEMRGFGRTEPSPTVPFASM